MISKKKNQHDDEIDFIQIILIILNNKFKIFLITFASVIAMFIYQTNQQTLYLAKTEIKQISTVDQFEFETYNSYINHIFPKYKIIENESDNKLSNETDYGQMINLFSNKSLQIIDEDYLYYLFITKFKDYEFIRNELKKFIFIKEEDYENKEAYEDALIKISYSITILPPDNKSKINTENFSITTKTYDVTKWKKFLEDT